MKQKVLFLGCNYDQVPYLKAIKKLGFIIIGTDLNPEAPGVELVDSFYNIGYTDIEALIETADSERFMSDDKIFTAASHFAYEGASAVAEKFNIAYIKKRAVDICLDKSKFYEYLRKFGVPVPETQEYDPARPNEIQASKTYFLKSDYGKSPNYCFRIVNGEIPQLPYNFDPYFRRIFLLQEEIKGTHFRLNFYSGQVSVLLKLSDSACVPLETIGLGHINIVEKLSEVIKSLGLSRYLIKFDLIVNESGWYVIDLGLDPPLRLMLLCNHLGYNFAYAYSKHYLVEDNMALPKWVDICRPILISGSPQDGFDYHKYNGDKL